MTNQEKKDAWELALNQKTNLEALCKINGHSFVEDWTWNSDGLMLTTKIGGVQKGNLNHSVIITWWAEEITQQLFSHYQDTSKAYSEYENIIPKDL